MFRTRQEITSLAAKVKGLLDSKQVSIETLTRATGLNAETIGQFLKGTNEKQYKTAFDRIAEAIQKVSIAYELPQQRHPFVETSASRRIFEVARACQSFREFSVVVANAGAGKTMALVEFARRNKDTILLQADTTYNARVLFFELYRKVCIGSPARLHDAAVEIEAKLKDSGRMIIVDEADLVDHRAIEQLRRLHDQAGIGVLLAGLPRLVALLRGKRGEFAQLYSRVGFCVTIEDVSEEDVSAMVKSALPGVNGQWKIFNKYAKGNARRLRKLLDRAKRISEINHVEINEAVVQSAASMLID